MYRGCVRTNIQVSFDGQLLQCGRERLEKLLLPFLGELVAPSQKTEPQRAKMVRRHGQPGWIGWIERFVGEECKHVGIP